MMEDYEKKEINYTQRKSLSSFKDCSIIWSSAYVFITVSISFRTSSCLLEWKGGGLLSLLWGFPHTHITIQHRGDILAIGPCGLMDQKWRLNLWWRQCACHCHNSIASSKCNLGKWAKIFFLWFFLFKYSLKCWMPLPCARHSEHYGC